MIVPEEGSSHVERFTSAVTAIIGKEPPAAMVQEWLEDVEVNGAWRLQNWVGMNLPANLQWVQCIVLLDAARELAEGPEEGKGHHPWPAEQQAAH